MIETWARLDAVRTALGFAATVIFLAASLQQCFRIASCTSLHMIGARVAIVK